VAAGWVTGSDGWRVATVVSAGWIADSVLPTVDGKRREPADREVSGATVEDTVMMK
jgi:hypothetical protein